MSKLMEKLKKESGRLKEAAASRQDFGPKIDWFKPQAGENLIRFLPNMKDEGDLPFRLVRIHYINVKKNDGGFANIPARCLQELGETCPICKAYEKTIKTDKEKAKNFRITERYLYNVLDYKTRKVQPFAAGITVHQVVMDYIDDFGENLFSVDAGRDWKLVQKVDPRKPKGLGTSYSARPGVKDSAVPEKLKPLLEGAVDLSTLYATNEKAKMLAFLGETPDEEEEDDVPTSFDEEEEEPVKKTATSADKAKAAAEAAKAKAKKTTKPKDEEEEEDDDLPKFEDDEDEEEDEDDDKPAKKSKGKVDVDDDELDQELRDLGVM
jgi:hypothetical protein